jgi:hypothetical protein
VKVTRVLHSSHFPTTSCLFSLSDCCCSFRLTVSCYFPVSFTPWRSLLHLHPLSFFSSSSHCLHPVMRSHPPITATSMTHISHQVVEAALRLANELLRFHADMLHCVFRASSLTNVVWKGRERKCERESLLQSVPGDTKGVKK